MAAQSYDVEFHGYYCEPNKEGLPAKSGIYCVYRAVHNVDRKTVTLNQLIYIGESEDVRARVADHDRLDDWSELLKQGEVLCYSYALVPSPYRVRVEAALIFKHKPPLNTEYSGAFPFDDTTISITGVTAAKLITHFVVQRT